VINLSLHIEAILFSAEKPVTILEIVGALNNLGDDFFETSQIEQAVNDLIQKYKSEAYAFGISEIGGGYAFFTKPEYHDTLQTIQSQKAKKSLSNAALETLSIIAYRQPIAKTAIEQIRGVNCDYTINKLLDKELIEISGRDDGPGRPILYALSDTFLDYFGINSADDLPRLKEIVREDENIIGETEA
jgi:segregation and condensation protein B